MAFSLGGLARTSRLVTAGGGARQQHDIWERDDGARGCNAYGDYFDLSVYVWELTFLIVTNFPSRITRSGKIGNSASSILWWFPRTLAAQGDVWYGGSGSMLAGAVPGASPPPPVVLAESASPLLCHSAGFATGVSHPRHPTGHRTPFGSEGRRDRTQGGGALRMAKRMLVCVRS